MSMRFLDIWIQGEREAHERLMRGAGAARNLRPALAEIRLDIFRVIRATFTSQGRRYGGSWKGLDPRWLERKTAAGQDPRILIGRGRLMRSFSDRASRYMRTRITGSRVEIESTLEYAAVHQYGSEDGHIPARPYIDFDERDRQRWAKMGIDHIMRAMRV